MTLCFLNEKDEILQEVKISTQWNIPYRYHFKFGQGKRPEVNSESTDFLYGISSVRDMQLPLSWPAPAFTSSLAQT